MPDWTYQTVFKPILFRLPTELARRLALGSMGRLAQLPFGGWIIDFMGHMRPAKALEQDVLGCKFPSSVGLGTSVDPESSALLAMQRFGVGFLEVGPVWLAQHEGKNEVQLSGADESYSYATADHGLSVDQLIRQLPRSRKLKVPLMVRLGSFHNSDVAQSTNDSLHLIQLLRPYAEFFSLTCTHLVVSETWSIKDFEQHLKQLHKTFPASEEKPKFLLCLQADWSGEQIQPLIEVAAKSKINAVMIEGCVQREENNSSKFLYGKPAHDPALELVKKLRDDHSDLTIIASGGIHEPYQALEFLKSGANLIQVDSGIVFSGPGLPKRINEAILYERQQAEIAIKKNDQSIEEVSHTELTAFEQSWFWTMLMGAAMFFGGLLAMLIASTRVVLAYDEQFVGMTRDELHTVNDRLLSFMTHDRVTLAGTMLCLGVLYSTLSWFGIRRGVHWAKVAVLCSAFVGFFAFFLFLGFGYFDPFHAFVTVILFQFLLMALHSKLTPQQVLEVPNLRNDPAWYFSQWGQLLFVIHGAVLMVAGSIISSFGITTVFVAEDLHFMQTTVEELNAANPLILPLIAHDRATFGGMLISIGVTVFLASLWGFRQGVCWLWWGIAIAGTIAYLSTIWVHMAVGYTHLKHLLPAYGGFVMLVLGLVLSYPYLCAKSSATNS